MVPFKVLLLLVIVLPFTNAASVVMKENDAKAFFDKLKFWKDEIDHECFKEGCDYAEVVNHYGHTEKSYEYWNKYQCKKFGNDCDAVACRGFAIGMENGNIKGPSITASSWFTPYTPYRPDAGRLNKQGETWCPSRSDKTPYLQVEFTKKQEICAVATQGSALYNSDFVKSYSLETSNDGRHWTVYTQKNGSDQVFPGNSNGNDMVKNNLPDPVAALFVRLVPRSWNSWPCMRAEFYGKPAPGCDVKTTDGKCCVFPFVFEGEKYYKCISKSHWRTWCATTGNYDENEDEWGNCEEQD